MKKILLLILLLFTIKVYSLEVNIDNINDNYELYTYIEITSLDNIDKINNLVNLKEIYIKNVNIEDISFINNLKKLEKITIYYSRVDLSKINNPNIIEMNIISSYVVNDNFSYLANSNLKILDLEGSYITSIYTLKDVISLEEVNLSSISNLRSMEPITNLPKLKKLNFSSNEDLINNKVLEFIRKNNITGTNYDESKYMYLNGEEITNKLDEIINNLELDNLSDIEKIRKITLFVVDNIEYDDECGVNGNCKYDDINFNSLLKSLSGKGVCYHYAILTNKLLNKVGIKSYLVSGYTKAGLGHEWLNIYLDDKWYGLDPTWIKFEGRSNTLRNTKTCRYFMVELKENNYFYTEHIEDVLPSNIVDVNRIIVDNTFLESNKNIYEYIFVALILIIPIWIIIVINKKLK